jgi:hypothetical protein
MIFINSSIKKFEFRIIGASKYFMVFLLRGPFYFPQLFPAIGLKRTVN